MWLNFLRHPISSWSAMPQGTTVVSLRESQLLEAIMSIKDSVSLVILFGGNCVKPKSCDVDVNWLLSVLFKRLTLKSPRRIHSLRDNWDNRLRNTLNVKLWIQTLKQIRGSTHYKNIRTFSFLRHCFNNNSLNLVPFKIRSSLPN